VLSGLEGLLDIVGLGRRCKGWREIIPHCGICNAGTGGSRRIEGWRAHWYLTTYENEWNDEHVDKQVERN